MRSARMKGQGADRVSVGVGGTGPATTFEHVNSYSRQGGYLSRRSSLREMHIAVVGQLGSLRAAFYSTGHSVQRERGFTAAAPHVIRQSLERVRQDKTQEPQFVSSVAAVSMSHHRTLRRPKSWNSQPMTSVQS